MNTIFKLAALFLFSNLLFSQEKICDFETNIVTDTSSTRVLTDEIIDESIFGNTTSFLTFKMFEVDGVLGINFQYLQKSKDFLTPICIDKNTKIVLELANGKQVKLVNSTDLTTCNELQYDAINKNNLRVLNGFFYFSPENFTDLKTEKVYLIIRKDHMRASKIMQDRVFANQKIEVLFEHETEGLTGDKVMQIKNQN